MKCIFFRPKWQFPYFFYIPQLVKSVPDPDLEINRGGGGLPKMFSALRASVWSKNRRVGLGPPPWIRHWKSPPFHIPEAWRWYTLWAELPCKGRSRKNPQPPREISQTLCVSQNRTIKQNNNIFVSVGDVQVVSFVLLALSRGYSCLA